MNSYLLKKIKFLASTSKPIIAPSILSADFSCLKKEIHSVQKAGASWLHIDVMDGHFVPNITIGPAVVKSIRKITDMFLDVHLMIENPDRFVQPFIEAGSNGITLHIESIPRARLVKLLDYIRRKNILAGVSLKPATSPEVLKQLLPYIDLILVMSVEPGFGGQKYIPASTSKIKQIKKMIDSYSITFTPKTIKPLISVDGGIDISTIKYASAAGAQVFVAGNAIFSSPEGFSPYKAYKHLYRRVVSND